jgi:hypothetical protein
MRGGMPNIVPLDVESGFCCMINKGCHHDVLLFQADIPSPKEEQ